MDLTYYFPIKYPAKQNNIDNIKDNKQYKNKVIFSNDNFSISYERAFSPPEDLDTRLLIQEKEDIKEIETGFDDTFTNYLKDVYKRYKNNDIDTINKEFKDSTEEFLNFKKELK